MKITKGVKQVAVAFAISVLLSGVSYASPSGSITVTNLGPLGSFGINTTAFDGTSGQIEKLTFDLSGTHCVNAGCVSAESLVFGGLSGSSFIRDPLANGTSILFGAAGSTVFGFDFTGFDSLDRFQFSWDPDVASDSDYGAIVAELAGTVISASVRFDDSSVLVYSGTMRVAGTDVVTHLVPVPEPETYVMMLAGLGLIGFVGYRRKQNVAI